MMPGDHREALTERRVVLATLIAGAAVGRPWQPLPAICEAVASVHGLRRARPAALSGLSELLARHLVDCRVVPAGRRGAGGCPAAAEFRAATGRAAAEPHLCLVEYTGEGRWTVRAGDRTLTGIAGLEDATWAALDLMQAA